MSVDRSTDVHKMKMQLRAKLAGLSRSRPADDPDLLDARRELAVLKVETLLADYRADPANPPLEVTQIQRILAMIEGQ